MSMTTAPGRRGLTSNCIGGEGSCDARAKRGQCILLKPHQVFYPGPSTKARFHDLLQSQAAGQLDVDSFERLLFRKLLFGKTPC